MNYAEEITYWFYRLNGYFLIRNFVIHNIPENRLTSGSDVDILAIRFPYVREEVGGQEGDWHPTILEFIEGNTISALIIEVKSGNYNAENLFLREDIEYLVPRFGCFSDLSIDDYNNIEVNSNYLKQPENVRISKILAATNTTASERFHSISIDEMKTFIRSRINRYGRQKYQSRLFFPSDLLQLLISEEHNRVGAEIEEE